MRLQVPPDAIVEVSTDPSPLAPPKLLHPPPSSGKKESRKRRSISSVGSIFNDSRMSASSAVAVAVAPVRGGFDDSVTSSCSSTSFSSSSHRHPPQTRSSYSRPGPPTPAKRARRGAENNISGISAGGGLAPIYDEGGKSQMDQVSFPIG